MKIVKFIIILIIVTSCGRPLPKGDFDSAAWKADPLACKDKRVKLIPGFETIKDNLRGVSEKDLQLVLGKPELTSLTEQSERNYIYFLEPGSQCQDKTKTSSANKLIIRISSLGWVTELTYENPVPKP